MCLENYIFGLYVSRLNLIVRVLRSTTIWRQALLYLLHAAHARREPISLDQVGPLCRRGEKRGRQSDHGCLLVDSVRLGQDGDEESRVQNVTVRGAAVPGPEPVYTPCGDCACRWPVNSFTRLDTGEAAFLQ
jgi:hypothetical protein